MKNSKLVKIVFIIIMSLIIIFATKNVFAATSLTDGTLTGTSTSGNSTGTSISGGSTNSGNNTVSSTPGTSLISGENTTGKSDTNNTVLKTSNTSNYNNTSLPKTGVGDSMPIVVFTVVLGISAVYAYKKIQDYKNI